MKAIIFDLDGVIVSTDEYHFQAWKMIAEKENIYFDRCMNEQLRGVSRMESLEMILKNSSSFYTNEKKTVLALQKNEYYKKLLNNLTSENILPGVINFLKKLKYLNIKTAVASSSKNAGFILKKISLKESFDIIVDGNSIKKCKPDPEVFLLAAQKLGITPENCIVIEDAVVGIDAALAAGMKTIGIGFASSYIKAHYKIKTFLEINFDELQKL